MVTDKGRRAFLKATLSEKSMPYIETACYNLSSILGDLGGKLNPTMASSIYGNSNIVFPGIVLLDSISEQDYRPLEYTPVIETLGFNTELSTKAYTLYSSLRSGSNDFITLKEEFSEDRSPMLSQISSLPNVIKGAICSIYLETFSIYLSLLDYGCKETKEIYKSDIQRSVSNIYWVSLLCEQLVRVPYELVDMLRLIQRTLQHVSSIEILFETVYSDIHNKVYGEVFEDV